MTAHTVTVLTSVFFASFMALVVDSKSVPSITQWLMLGYGLVMAAVLTWIVVTIAARES